MNETIVDNTGDSASDDELLQHSPFDITQLPQSFKTFLSTNAIDPKIYTVEHLPRYIRWNTHFATDQLPSIDQLQSQLNTDRVWEINGMPGFFGFQLLDQKQPLRLYDIPAYQQHAIFGIDLSSAIAVEALTIERDDHVLDLCCAPGAKLCMIANVLGTQGLGTVTGVDIAAHRLATCRSMIKKYRVGPRIRLYEADGTTFDVTAPSRLGAHRFDNDDDTSGTKKRRKLDSQKPFWAPKTLRYDPGQGRLYDKVLVDAECTHDGSISHIIKYEKWGWDAFEKNFMDTNRLDTICELQRNLMAQGWALLRKKGIMVYSTCSLTIKQNEENVAWFLKQHPEAELETVPLVSHLGIPLAKIKRTNHDQHVQTLMDKYCVRFDPLISRTSGFFLARFRKVVD